MVYLNNSTWKLGKRKTSVKKFLFFFLIFLPSGLNKIGQEKTSPLYVILLTSSGESLFSSFSIFPPRIRIVREENHSNVIMTSENVLSCKQMLKRDERQGEEAKVKS